MREHPAKFCTCSRIQCLTCIIFSALYMYACLYFNRLHRRIQDKFALRVQENLYAEQKTCNQTFSNKRFPSLMDISKTGWILDSLSALEGCVYLQAHPYLDIRLCMGLFVLSFHLRGPQKCNCKIWAHEIEFSWILSTTSYISPISLRICRWIQCDGKGVIPVFGMGIFVTQRRICNI